MALLINLIIKYIISHTARENHTVDGPAKSFTILDGWNPKSNGIPSGYVKIAIENGPVEIGDLPII